MYDDLPRTLAPKKRRHTRKDGTLVTVWQGQYLDAAGEMWTRSGFATAKAAKKWAEGEVSQARRGEWVDPVAGDATVGELAEQWFGAKRKIGAHRRKEIRDLFNNQILYVGRDSRGQRVPYWIDRPVARVTKLGVQQWLAALEVSGLSASRVTKAFYVLQSVLDFAVELECISRNPCRPKSPGSRIGRVELPKLPPPRKRALTAEQVADVALAVRDVAAPFNRGHAYMTLILVKTYGVMRWSEVVGLRRRNADLLHRCVRYRGNATTVGGRIVEQARTKNEEDVRSDLPDFVCEMLGMHLRAVPDDPDALIFTAPKSQDVTGSRRGRQLDGGWLRHRWFLDNVWYPARRLAGLDDSWHLHDLRHTGTTLMVAHGAEAKTVQEQGGWRSIAVPYETYTHLREGHADPVFARLDEELRTVFRDREGTEHESDVIELRPRSSGRGL